MEERERSYSFQHLRERRERIRANLKEKLIRVSERVVYGVFV